MTPTQTMLRNFAIAATAGAFLGYQLSTHVRGQRKHKGQYALLGATGVMILYGATKERVQA